MVWIVRIGAGKYSLHRTRCNIVPVNVSNRKEVSVLSFPELKLEADQRLIDFLKVELKLGFTFVDLAEQHRAEKDRAKSLENARKAVETIRRFQRRVKDHAEWTRIQTETDELEKLICAKQPAE